MLQHEAIILELQLYVHISTHPGYLGTLISKLLSQPERVAKSTVFAISSIVRNLPAALDVFSRLHGYNTLTTKLALSSLGPLQRAIVTFYNDLLEQESEVICSISTYQTYVLIHTRYKRILMKYSKAVFGITIDCLKGPILNP